METITYSKVKVYSITYFIIKKYNLNLLSTLYKDYLIEYQKINSYSYFYYVNLTKKIIFINLQYCINLLIIIFAIIIPNFLIN